MVAILKSLELENFRGFTRHQVRFGRETLLIGRNNAGKTTVIEALRVLSVCQLKAATPTFAPAPSWVNGATSEAGFRVNLDTIDFDFSNVQHAYNSSRPAIIRASLSNNSYIRVYIGNTPQEVFVQIGVGQRQAIHQRSDMRTRSFGSTKVMPPIGSLLPREKSISKERLTKYLDGYLAYRHFRNQLWEKSADYRRFKDLLSETWHGIDIQHFENDHGEKGNEFSLLVREGRFTSEISWHGHGLQAWMQTLWFLSRTQRDSTVVLDEPDVYLHADLQRKLIKVIESLQFAQSIIATHSSEIIGDVPFTNVVAVQKANDSSGPARNAAEIQSALQSLGSLHSIQLAKLAENGKLLFVEGGDRSYLMEVAFKLGPKVYDNFARIAVHETEGRGNWKEAVGAAKTLSKVSSGQVNCYAVFDRDYMQSGEEDKISKQATVSGLNVKIWARKEIESYFVEAACLERLIRSNLSDQDVELDAQSLIDEAAESLLPETRLIISDEIQQKAGKKPTIAEAFRQADDYIKLRSDQGLSTCDIVNGKKLISALSKRCTHLYRVSFSAMDLLKEMKPSEIPEELKDYILFLS